MPDSALSTYLATVQPRWAPLVRALHEAVLAAAPELEVHTAYRMLLYTRGRDYRHWVCAIGPTKAAVCLRFLYGVLLDDPQGRLRPGTSTLKTLDIPSLEALDTEVVAGYVRQAVTRLDTYLAQ